jgi:hypothetical protein
LLTSCGYQLAGLSGGPAAPRESISVPFFSNTSGEPLIEEELTREVRQEVVEDGRLQLVNAPGAAWVLTGEVVSYQEIPLAFDEDQNVQQYRVTLTVNVDLQRSSSTESAWSEVMTRSSEYPVTADIMTTRNLKRQAIEDLAENFARDLVDKLIGGYR